MISKDIPFGAKLQVILHKKKRNFSEQDSKEFGETTFANVQNHPKQDKIEKKEIDIYQVHANLYGMQSIKLNVRKISYMFLRKLYRQYACACVYVFVFACVKSPHALYYRRNRPKNQFVPI